jgi:hypothetical protein
VVVGLRLESVRDGLANSSLVASVSIGEGVYVGSGSVITQGVPADALAVERAQQVVRKGWAAAPDAACRAGAAGRKEGRRVPACRQAQARARGFRRRIAIRCAGALPSAPLSIANQFASELGANVGADPTQNVFPRVDSMPWLTRVVHLPKHLIESFLKRTVKCTHTEKGKGDKEVEAIRRAHRSAFCSITNNNSGL